MVTTPVDSACANLTRGEALCGVGLDREGDHSVICSVGPWRLHRHDSLCDVWADILTEIGAYVRREVLVPEMHVRGVDAILDIGAYGLIELPDLLADVTVRHPCSDLYLPTSGEITGYAASRGEVAKALRYPPCSEPGSPPSGA
jgi:hypothetical protein